MNNIFYIVGVVVVTAVILEYFGLRRDPGRSPSRGYKNRDSRRVTEKQRKPLNTHEQGESCYMGLERAGCRLRGAVRIIVFWAQVRWAISPAAWDTFTVFSFSSILREQ